MHFKWANTISITIEFRMDFNDKLTSLPSPQIFLSFFFLLVCHPFKRFGSWSNNHLLFVKHWALYSMQLRKPFTERFCFAILSAVSLELKTLVTIRKLYTKCIWATWNFKICFLDYEFQKTKKIRWKKKNPKIWIVLVDIWRKKSGYKFMCFSVFFHSTVIVVLLFIYGSSASDSLEWACACWCRTIIILFGNSENERKKMFACLPLELWMFW